jgi:peptidylprolyl isomerase
MMGRKKVVKAGRNISVHYTGTLDDGTTFDSSRTRDPISFEVGSGHVIPGFDEGVKGMHAGETKQVKILSEDAYGDRNEAAVITVPHDAFPQDLELQIGMTVQGSGPDGDFPAIVTAIASEGITIDCNHPLAGQNLNFEIEVVEVS